MIDHHAVLLAGSSLLQTGYDVETLKTQTELEFFYYDVLSISEVRTLIKEAFVKPFTFSTKTMVIEASSIAIEAQQALLKVLEEPPSTTKFIIVLKSTTALLPTLLSRMAQPTDAHTTTFVDNPAFTAFRQSSYADRLALIAKITKDKNQTHIDQLRDGVLWLTAATPKEIVTERLLHCATQMNLRGSSKKMLLEEIALTLPVVP